jgi:peptidoglycan/LPS O-acetylase OafA/YrhL
MGLIRLLLALSVVSAHTKSHRLLQFVGGEIAVEMFFMISGFYMAMVHQNYTSKSSFWISRYIRLYPTFILCALFALLTKPDLNGYLDKVSSLPLSAAAFLFITNLTIFFQDASMFMGVSSTNLFFTKNFVDSNPPLHELLLIPQGWSLGLELLFYFFVPFLLNKSPKTIIGIILLSLCLKIILQHYGFEGDPWSYRFFPSEISMFLLGSVAYQIYPPTLWGKHASGESLSTLYFGIVIAAVLFFPFLPMDYQQKKIAIYAIFLLSMGRIFQATKSSPLDGFLGSLSYPIYCCHLVVLSFALPKFSFWQNNGSLQNTLFSFLVIAVIASGIHYFVERPVDAYRARFKLGENQKV